MFLEFAKSDKITFFFIEIENASLYLKLLDKSSPDLYLNLQQNYTVVPLCEKI